MRKKSQNFLIDGGIAERMIGYADVGGDDIVLEIGPGYGILTKRLAEKADKVIAVEIDEKLAESIEKLDLSNVEVIEADAMKVDLSSIDFNKVVSNLPYQISSPITFKLLEEKFDLAVMMYQREFASRLMAKRGGEDYCRLSVAMKFKADCELMELVPSKAFRPQPKVNSCIVKMIPHLPPFDVDERIFFEVARMIFGHRRKKIRNALIAEGIEKEWLKNLPYMDKRSEELSPEQIGELSERLETLNVINV